MTASTPSASAPPFFSRQFDRRVWTLLGTMVVCGAIGTPLLIYVAWPTNVRVGYRPEQPIAFSHQLHAGALRIECRYCHVHVDSSAHATVPALSICMNCHSVFKGDPQKPGQTDKIKALRDHWETKTPVAWNRIHDLADFVYFHHGRHRAAGLDCRSCHGVVETMQRVERVSPLTMGWCLDCHHGRGRPIFTPKAIQTGTAAQPYDDPIYRKLLAPIHCSTCHR